MQLVSWNVNGIRAWHKKGASSWFFDVAPDVFCMQETKAEQSQLPDILANPPNYHAYFDHSRTRKGYSGVGIYSKIEPHEVRFGLGNESLDQEGRLITAYFDEYILLNCYFPNGGGGRERLEFKLAYYDAFFEYIEELRKEAPVIFCGDVNTAHTPIDLARPKENEKNTGFLPEERAWIDRLVAAGWIDVFRAQYPNAREKYTYWDMKTRARERNVGWRIDYFFVSNNLWQSVRKATIFDAVLGSDHCPIGLEIDEEKL